MRLGGIGVAAIIPLAFILLCDAHEELPWNQTLTKRWGWGPLDLRSDPFAITTDRAMINVA
jgi:hypothetical protein